MSDDSHYKYMMVLRQSYVYNGNSYTSNTAPVLWDGPQAM